MPVDYANGKIYKIVCNKTGLVYIGSTAQKYLSTRLAGHVSSYTYYLKGKGHNTSSYKVLEGGDFSILLIESCACSSKDELRAKERFYIESNVCINKNVPNRNMEEYTIANYEFVLARNKKYYNNNKEARLQQKKEYYILNAETIKAKRKEYLEANKDRLNETQDKEAIKLYHKQYREEHKEARAIYGKQYKLDNKNKINEQARLRRQIAKTIKNNPVMP
jgi:hypothetical protein